MPELSPEALTNICDDSCLDFETTADLPPLQAIIGQQRAVQSLEFGLDIEERGFNIFAAGPSGTGRSTAITAFLEELAQQKSPPMDWCYVNNFYDSAQPQALQLPPGRGRALQRDMRSLVTEARREITRGFEGEEYSQRREEFSLNFRRERDQLFTALNDQAREEGFNLQTAPVGVVLMPLFNGKPITEEDVATLSVEERDRLSKVRDRLEVDLKAVINKVRAAERAVNGLIQELDEQVVGYAIGFLVQEVREKYQGLPWVLAYLEEVEKDMVDNVELFRSQPQDGQHQPPTSLSNEQGTAMRRYEVNVVVDNASLQGAPVVVEVNPTHNNLLGRVEREAQYGALQTDLTMIRPGSLHRANGGFLILRIEEVLRNPMAWEGLKRCLKEEKIIIEEMAERMGFISTKGLSPQPIPLKVKTILIGSPMLYHTLYMYDPDFVELFKVKAEFDSTMERTDDNVRDYAAFICALCSKENLLQMDRGGVTKLVEHSSRLAEDQTKLSTRFAEVSDIIREASYWATKADAPCINAEYMNRAIDERSHRSDLIRGKIVEMTKRGFISISTFGSAVGQVNGLAVVGLGDFSFGRPGRITVTVAPGRDGLMDIEREARLGGRLHSKGVMIMGGYLADTYAQDIPLSLSARLTFEQSYDEVDGDSASSAELYALISRLSGAPIKQGIAVTGSVNQKGEVQAIGGVNHKIEGFFYVCQATGLSGEQGVMIPASNVQNLMLREEVVDAVRQGKFHVWAVGTIDEGVEVLTGQRAGSLLPDGSSFEEGSVNDRVSQRLRGMATGMRDFMRTDDHKEPEEAEEEKPVEATPTGGDPGPGEDA